MPEYVKLTKEQLDSLVKNAVDNALKERDVERVIYVPVERTVYVEREHSASLDETLLQHSGESRHSNSEPYSWLPHYSDEFLRMAEERIRERKRREEDIKALEAREILYVFRNEPELRSIALAKLDT